MNFKLLFLFGFIFLITFTSAQLGYNNPNLPRISSPTTIPTSSSGGSGNVTSVSSGDNCIFVSPTTGDVQITFNTSCGGSGSGDGSFNITYQTFAYNQTSPALTYVRTYYYNKTEINSFNASWISTFNITYQTFAYNQTTAVFNTILLNNTIAQYGNLIGFNSTFNSTYAQFAYNQTRAINPFNQDLNTTSDVIFDTGFFSNKVTMDLGDPGLEWISFTALGGFLEVADLNFGLGSFVFQARSNLNLFFATDALESVIGLYDDGTILSNSLKGFTVTNNTFQSFKTNNTLTEISTNILGTGQLNNYTGSTNVDGNMTVGRLIQLRPITLPTCNTASNGSIGMNGSGHYACFNTWQRLY